MRSEIVWMIIGMGLVTYIPRMLPLAVFHRVKLPPFLQGVLKNVPYATLGALIVPGIFLFMKIYGLAFSDLSAPLRPHGSGRMSLSWYWLLLLF